VLEYAFATLLEPALKLRHGDDLAPAEANEANLVLDVLVPQDPGDTERLARLANRRRGAGHLRRLSHDVSSRGWRRGRV
jgi:hypothetical protein